MLVYCIINTRNSKRYIGITTVSLSARWTQHVRDAAAGKTSAMARAIRKYGSEAFVVEEIASLLPGLGKEDLFALERELISQEGTMTPKGYNITAGGQGILSAGYPEELRARLSMAHAGKPIPSIKGKALSEEHRAKLSAAWTPERREAQAERNRRYCTGVKQAPEVVAKRNAYWTPEVRVAHGLKVQAGHQRNEGTLH